MSSCKKKPFRAFCSTEEGSLLCGSLHLLRLGPEEQVSRRGRQEEQDRGPHRGPGPAPHQEPQSEEGVLHGPGHEPRGALLREVLQQEGVAHPLIAAQGGGLAAAGGAPARGI